MRRLQHSMRTLALTIILIMACSSSGGSYTQLTQQKLQREESFRSLDDILEYISADWDTLGRSLEKCSTYDDVKTPGEKLLYLPRDSEIPPVLAELQKRCALRVQRLPEEIAARSGDHHAEIHSHGLLYLENPYVVPGGQFNEMYGWDSYFIVRGLLRNGRRDLARGMVENFFYEIEHYGGVLNANRTYYLGRSQPPFLSSMVLAVYEADKAAGKSDRDWLERAYRFTVLDYDQWNREPHLAGDTKLSRYFDEGEGPVPEIVGGPNNYYLGVVHYFLMHEGENSSHLVQVVSQSGSAPVIGPVLRVASCDQKSSRTNPADCAAPKRLALTAQFYKGDRAMRESGFDVSFRFGPYGADTDHYAPVCLNSLLYKTEKDLEEISNLLGKQADAHQWNEKARERREGIEKYMWDSRRGLFFDYNFVTHKQSSYEYATTFYPLWVGLASGEQARAVDGNLHVFEQAGGVAMSRFESHAQWDYPYGWAPIHLLAVEGLRRYGYRDDADRITYKFLSMILDNFRRDHTMREKYNVITRSSETHISVGYKQNAAGFGWTNGVFLDLLHESPSELVNRLKSH